MKAYGGVDIYWEINILFPSALVEYEWPSSRPYNFNPVESAPGIYWI
jgi:hypothetical protein